LVARLVPLHLPSHDLPLGPNPVTQALYRQTVQMAALATMRSKVKRQIKTPPRTNRDGAIIATYS
jgi:hypothetical protein